MKGMTEKKQGRVWRRGGRGEKKKSQMTFINSQPYPMIPLPPAILSVYHKNNTKTSKTN
jgi:hypothetical protein